MFAIKDLESIKNLAAIMVIPFFSAAYIGDRALDGFNDPAMAWLMTINNLPLKIAGWSFFLAGLALVVTLIFAFVDYCIVWVHITLDLEYIMAIFGFASLTAGLFLLSFAIPGLPKSPLNPFWHLGFLCYGFSLFSRAGK